ncbi:unnamed protein product [Diplocarpon coronariae]
MTHLTSTRSCSTLSDPKNWTDFQLNELTPKPFGDLDVDIKIQACGVCASDLFTTSGGCGEQHCPLRAGHDDNERLCRHQLDTCGARWPDPGIIFPGRLTRRPTNRVFHIPDGLPTSKAAPLLCAGLTGCSSLGRNSAGARKRPDITGMSGIGHLGLLSSKALCAGTDWDRGWDREHIMKSDLIVCMASSTEGMDPGAYLQSLDVHGRFVGVASPEGSGQRVFFGGGGSHLGSKKEALAMLQLAVDKGVDSWVEEMKTSKEGLKEALARVQSNDVRYRFTINGYEDVYGA